MKGWHKTVFQYVGTGQEFQAMDGTSFIKRRENRRSDLVWFCHECDAAFGANAIVKGRKIDDTNHLEFVHFCPADYIMVRD